MSAELVGGTWGLAVAAGVVGYLLGSISFARIVVQRVAGADVEPVSLSTPDGRGRLQSNAVSATAVRLQLGPRWGLTVAALDILKALVPTLAFRLAFPGEPAYVIAAAAAVFGHVWPLYYGFRGGNGQSPIVGGMLVIDPLGAVVTAVLGQGFGFLIVRDGLFADVGHILLLIPWLWWRFGGDALFLGYAVAVNFAFWVSFWPSLRQYLALRRAGHLESPEDSVVMFRMDYDFMRKLSPRSYERTDAKAARPKDGTDATD